MHFVLTSAMSLNVSLRLPQFCRNRIYENFFYIKTVDGSDLGDVLIKVDLSNAHGQSVTSYEGSSQKLGPGISFYHDAATGPASIYSPNGIHRFSVSVQRAGWKTGTSSGDVPGEITK